MSSLSDSAAFPADQALAAAADAAVGRVLRVREGEKVLVVTNPEREVLEIACALYDSAARSLARPTLLVQGVKTQADDAEEAVIAAFESQPDVVVSLSAQKLGKDRSGVSTPYEWDGVAYDHVFHYQMRGAKTLRAFWSPGATRRMFAKAVLIDYDELGRRCSRVAAALAGAARVRVTAPGGTDIVVPVAGRAPHRDDGDYSAPGAGGNLPAGEVYLSPALGLAEGTVVFDLSLSDRAGDMLLREPVRCAVSGGLVVSIQGGPEAARLRAALEGARDAALRMADSGDMARERAEEYARNAFAIGELGVGLNPAAEVAGNMLEDEKAFRTCHFAVGSNCDDDAQALIHLDGLVSRPTIVAISADGRETVIERSGELCV